MKTIRLTGQVNANGQVWARVPKSVSAGPVELWLVVRSDSEDDAGKEWMDGIAQEWATELGDPREDIYSLSDGEPIDAAR